MGSCIGSTVFGFGVNFRCRRMETVLSTPPWDQMFGKSAEKVPVMQGWDKESRIIFMTLIIELGVSSFMCGY